MLLSLFDIDKYFAREEQMLMKNEAPKGVAPDADRRRAVCIRRETWRIDIAHTAPPCTELKMLSMAVIRAASKLRGNALSSTLRYFHQCNCIDRIVMRTMVTEENDGLTTAVMSPSFQVSCMQLRHSSGRIARRGEKTVAHIVAARCCMCGDSLSCFARKLFSME